jgi:hypothetical protein
VLPGLLLVRGGERNRAPSINHRAIGFGSSPSRHCQAASRLIPSPAMEALPGGWNGYGQIAQQRYRFL